MPGLAAPAVAVGTYKGHPVYVGPKGGHYYFNDKGTKVYIGKEKVVSSR